MADNSSGLHLICLGVISGAHGVRGQVKIRSFTSSPDDISSYGALRDKAGKIYNINITGRTNDVLIASIDGIDDRDSADKLRNIELFVERSALPEPDKDEYYLEDLMGLEVLTQDNMHYGYIISVNNFGAGDILEIKLASGKEEFQPFNKSIFPVIDIKNKRLIILPPENIE